jgi:hypothetical protein
MAAQSTQPLETVIDECNSIQLIDKLTNYVNGLNYLKNKISLLSPLKDARSLLSDSNTHNDKGACGDLKNLISTGKELQKSGKITSQDANSMIAQANQIMTVLKCWWKKELAKKEIAAIQQAIQEMISLPGLSTTHLLQHQEGNNKTELRSSASSFLLFDFSHFFAFTSLRSDWICDIGMLTVP